MRRKAALHILFILYKQKISMRAISIAMDSMFPLKVLIINKSKHTHHNCQQMHSQFPFENCQNRSERGY